MASIKETAQKELNLYQGISTFIDKLKNSNQLSETIISQLEKIQKREHSLQKFLSTSKKLSDAEVEKNWENLKAENVLMLNETERREMNGFFQNIKDSIAATKEYQNLYKIYINNVVSEKSMDEVNLKHDKATLKAEFQILSKKCKELKVTVNDIEQADYQNLREEKERLFESILDKYKHKENYKNLQKKYDDKIKEFYEYHNKKREFKNEQDFEKELKRISGRKVALKEVEPLLKEFKNVVAEINNADNSKDLQPLKEKRNDLQKKCLDLQKKLVGRVSVTEIYNTSAEDLMKAFETESEQYEKDIHEMYSGYKKLKEMQHEILTNPKVKNEVERYKQIEKMEEIKAQFDKLNEKTKGLNTRINDSIKTMENSPINTAAVLFEQIDVRQGKHQNSKEYQKMKEALDIVSHWNEKKDTLQGVDGAPKSLDEAWLNLQKTAETYLNVKHAQFRPFESSLRRTRLDLAETIKGLAEKEVAKREQTASKKLDVAEVQQNAKTTNVIEYNQIIIK